MGKNGDEMKGKREYGGCVAGAPFGERIVVLGERQKKIGRAIVENGSGAAERAQWKGKKGDEKKKFWAGRFSELGEREKRRDERKNGGKK